MKHDSTEGLIKSGIAAKKLGISPRLLIKYEKSNLLLPNKTNSGLRLYSETDLDWCEFVHYQISENKKKIADFHLLLALIPCWEIKIECSRSDCKRCKAYKNFNIICWAFEEQGSRICRNADCRSCKVYQYATQPSNIEKIYAKVNGYK